MPYEKVGPFTNDSATPPIDKTFLDGLETWAESAEDNAEATAAALDQAHEDATAPHGYHPRYFVGNGSGTYAATQDMRIYVSHTTDEADPVLTGLPAGIIVVTVPGT